MTKNTKTFCIKKSFKSVISHLGHIWHRRSGAPNTEPKNQTVINFEVEIGSTEIAN